MAQTRCKKHLANIRINSQFNLKKSADRSWSKTAWRL